MSKIAVLHIPHSSTVVPPEHRATILLSDDELQEELLRMTDWFTDELFAAKDKCYSVRFPISRLVLDPERFEDDDHEIMSSRGMGIIYTRTACGSVLRNPSSANERNELIEKYYRPHHKALLDSVTAIQSKCTSALVIDCHSFPSRPQPYELDQNIVRPDICLGSDDYHTPRWFLHNVKELFEHAGLSVFVNRPFAGALVPSKAYRCDPSVCSIMIELNRRIYMDEKTGDRNSYFNTFGDLLRNILNTLVDNFEKRMKSPT